MAGNQSYINSYCFYRSVVLLQPLTVLFLLLFVLQSEFVFVTGSIGCFKCVSINGNNPACDDPFHNNYTVDILESPCMGGRKGRNGLFPATACIKLTGVYDDTGDRITVRSCALDSGTLTTDTELIRMSHCGGFYFDDRYARGCVQSCDDGDACNSSGIIHPTHSLLLITTLFMLINSTRYLNLNLYSHSQKTALLMTINNIVTIT